jgi:hypothetical protein
MAALLAAERGAIATLARNLVGVGVTPLVLKGAALAHSVYAVPWERPHSDVDVMIPADRAGAVHRVLVEMGYEPAREVLHPLLTGQRHYYHRGPLGIALDVHTRLVNPWVLRNLPDYDELAGRAVPVPALGPHARVLSRPDALLHALVHRVAHHNSSDDPLWLSDIALLAAGMSGDGWRLVVSLADRAAVRAIARDGLLAARARAGAAVPPWVLDAMHGGAGEASAALLGGRLTEWRLQWINFCSLPDWRTRARFVRAHVAPPPDQLTMDVGTGWRRAARYAARVARGLRKWAAVFPRCTMTLR